MKITDSTFRIRKVSKPWGREEWIALSDKYAGKLLLIKKNRRLSLQFHKKKHETLYLLSGKVRLILQNRIIIMHQGQSRVITPGTVHRIEALETDVCIIEVSTPELTDVVRLEDDFSRT